MAKKSKRRCDQSPVLHPNAAGIDVGSDALFVAVAADRDPEPIRFPTFTRDVNALADWLQHCGIETVAMESTSVYWIPVHQILESRGLEVYRVNVACGSMFLGSAAAPENDRPAAGSRRRFTSNATTTR